MTDDRALFTCMWACGARFETQSERDEHEDNCVRPPRSDQVDRDVDDALHAETFGND